MVHEKTKYHSSPNLKLESCNGHLVLCVVPLEKALCLHCLSLTPTSWNWEPAYAGSKPVIDWYPTQGESATLMLSTMDTRYKNWPCAASWLREDLTNLFHYIKLILSDSILDFIFFVDALRRKEKARTKEKRSRKEQRKEKDWRHPTKWRNWEWNQ